MRYLITHLSPDLQLFAGKALGAFVGSMISLAYVLPAGKREAAIRFLTGLSAGLIFGLPVGVWVSNKAGITDQLQMAEVAIMGAAISSLSIWTALGVARRLAFNQITQTAAPPTTPQITKPEPKKTGTPQ